jgi:hypothetical protein
LEFVRIQGEFEKKNLSKNPKGQEQLSKQADLLT